MTRRQERRWRTLQWLVIVAIGAVAAAFAWSAVNPGLAFGIALMAGMIAHTRMILSPGVAVLTYHSIADDPAWLPWAEDIALAPETLARHLETLAAMRCSVLSTRDYIATREAGEALPDRPVLLHFDDGYLDNFIHAVPLLTARAMPATFFASVDFIEPGEAPRSGDADPCGYMNWAELSLIEAQLGLEVEPHGVDHGRVPISERAIGTLTAENWRRHAWMQWRETEGPKHDWHRRESPDAVPIGSAIPESGLALAERAWTGVAREPVEAFEHRVTHHLSICRQVFEERLRRTPQIFCWPENAAAPQSRTIAAALGYRATTGGKHRNIAAEPTAIISRIHIDDRALGFRWLVAEALHVRAVTRMAQGNLYWYLVAAPMTLTRAAIMALRNRNGRP